MKANIHDLRDSFKVGYDAYEDSRKEANEIWDMYHNRMYTQEQLAVLSNRGQPAETFNVVKLFSRMLVGYFSTIVNTVTATPVNPRDIDNASLLNDTIKYAFEDNRFDLIGDQIKLGGLISGILTCEVTVEDTGLKDTFGRPINRVNYEYVDDSEFVFDPMSQKDDYSDARWLHRFKWLTDDEVKAVFGKRAMDKLTAYYNFLNVDEADFEYNQNTYYNGRHRVFNNYLIVHTVMVDDEDRRWSCYWAGDVMLKKEEITEQDTKWPYRVQFLHSSNVKEYYGIFREVRESQRAINQALIKLQLMVNSEKAYVEDGAVEDIDQFTIAFNRVNSVIPVKSLAGLKVEQLSRETLDQYAIIDKAMDRIQRVLGINDSFLGMAFASDSGRKVKLQQNATIMSLRYITARIESFYRSLGEDTAKLIRQYYTANQMIMVSDEVAGQRWVELNRPMMEWSGKLDAMGQPVMQPILLPEEDPKTGGLLIDKEGNIVLGPVNELTSAFRDMQFNIKIDASAFNDEDEKAQLMLESVMSGQIGQMLAQVNPAGFFKVSSLAIKSMKTKYSPDIVQVLDQTAQMLGGDPAAQQQASMMAQGSSGGAPQQPMSKELKLPQNTNEDIV